MTIGVFTAWGAVPTFQDLMDPGVFPDPQRGMTVESVDQKQEFVRVTTTGAIIHLDASRGQIAFQQRIGHRRLVAVLELSRPFRSIGVTHKGPGFARITIQDPALTVRINGDSLCLIQAHHPVELRVLRRIVPAWEVSWKTNHLLVDELGGFALYCSDLSLDDRYDPLNEAMAIYALPQDAVLALGVCPPKPYDWDRSLHQQVIWHWSDKLAYPPDDDLRSWKPYGNMILLQSEVLLWKDWNLDFVPRLGVDEFVRVRKTIHGMDMPFIVYTSPFFFLKGTSQENQAVNDKPGVCPGAIVNGENMPLFLDAITRVMRDLKPDGLYFDGQYMENPAGLYALARHSRKIIGEEGILEWHSTTELGGGGSLMYMPHADAYTDIQLRGEGQDARYADFDYLRFFVSGYNVNNCIGVLCNNSGKMMSHALLESLLQANARLHTLIGNPAMCEFILKEYRPRLTPDLHKQVDQWAEDRQTHTREKADAFKTFLLQGPDWRQPPVFAVECDAMPDVKRFDSPANDQPFTIVDGSLHIRAHAHTFAYLRFPVDRHASGFVVRLRQGTDGGMSWGPSAMVRFTNGDFIRIGSRPHELQVDIIDTQARGGASDPAAWVWLRARWTEKTAVVEYGGDGVIYWPLLAFNRESGPDDKVTELLVGKVPFNGNPQDHTEPGPLGECDIDFVRLYDR
jgi:hypothetical protein